MDLKDNFHQVPMDEESMGQFEYTVIPFGLTNAPPVFQRIINKLLKRFIDAGRIVVFLDDIMIATRTLEEHKSILKEVLTGLSDAGLCYFKKCKFAHEEVD